MGKKNILRQIGLVFLIVFFLIASYGVTKALFRPGPKQKEHETDTQKTIEITLIETREARAELLRKELKRLPPFRPPDKNIITPDQMKTYVTINYYDGEIAGIGILRRPNYNLSFGTALFLARWETSINILLHVEKLIDYKMTEEEFEWIDKNVKKALALAMKRLYFECYGDQKPQEVSRALDDAAIYAHFSKKNEQNSFIADLDLIDPSEIPETNYRYVVSYYKWVEYYGINLENMNFKCLMERGNIQEASITPLEAKYPDEEKK